MNCCDKVGLKCGQVLLTWDDFDNRTRFLNARHTLEAILKKGVVPVINENDTTSTEEIKFGDNDKLSALVASLLHADLLVILSDVEGLYDANKKVYEEIREITPEIEGDSRRHQKYPNGPGRDEDQDRCCQDRHPGAHSLYHYCRGYQGCSGASGCRVQRSALIL